MKYIRIQATYNSKVTGKPCGIFAVMHGLVNRKALNEEEEKTFIRIRTWFEENLDQPDFYENGNTVQGITWFKPDSVQMIEKLKPLMVIMDRHGVEYEIREESNPGKIIYEDVFQIGTI